jgi:hypothetical protein
VPRGLAVSTVTTNDQLSYLAIDPEGDDEPSYPVNSDTIEQAADFQLRYNVRDVQPDLLTNAAVPRCCAMAPGAPSTPGADGAAGRRAPGRHRPRAAR